MYKAKNKKETHLYSVKDEKGNTLIAKALTLEGNTCTAKGLEFTYAYTW